LCEQLLEIDCFGLGQLLLYVYHACADWVMNEIWAAFAVTDFQPSQLPAAAGFQPSQAKLALEPQLISQAKRRRLQTLTAAEIAALQAENAQLNETVIGLNYVVDSIVPDLQAQINQFDATFQANSDFLNG
jgi:hypothetical protein